jgi:predicted dehydrogenase
MSSPFRIGVAGLGYWGPNLARSFHGLPGSELVWCCDASADARAGSNGLRVVRLLQRLPGELDRSRRAAPEPVALGR